LSLRGLTKTYQNGTQALKGIDLDVAEGDFFALLGPNGAGKTTSIGIVTSLVNKTAGSVKVFGIDADRDLEAAKSCIGLVPQEFNFNMFESPQTIVTNQAGFYGIPLSLARERAEKYLRKLQLWDKRKVMARSLSGGMKRRLTIARSLISNPEVLILDEPTTGLDPQARHLLWDRLYRLKSEGVTLIITTHYMDEAEQLCDRLVVMDGGRIVAEGSPRGLIEQHSTREVVELRFAIDTQHEHAELVADLAIRTEVLPDRVLLYVEDGDATVAAVHARSVKVESALVRRSSLEDVFLHLTGRTLVD
jgi:lipooligosaccharide transport system ATP-binding protein